MLQLLIQFAMLAAVIVVAGTFLAKFSDHIAELTGIGGSLAGLVLLAGATSLPELAVDCVFGLRNQADLAVGAVVGSSLFNLLILGMLDLFHRAPQRMLSPSSAKHALPAICSIILTSIVMVFLVIPFPISLANVGLGTVLVFVAYILCLRLLYLQQLEEPEEEPAAGSMTLQMASIGYLIATAAIFVTANFLASTAELLSVKSGLGDTFVGSTFVALTTSLPELVTTVAAVRMGAFDMAVGNIFGSNTFNMAILLPVDVVMRNGSLLNVAGSSHAVTCAAVVLITSLATAAMLYRSRRRIWWLEPNALMVVILAVASIYVLYRLSPINQAS